MAPLLGVSRRRPLVQTPTVTLVADACYSSANDALACEKLGSIPVFPVMRTVYPHGSFFNRTDFTHDAERDLMVCPAGKTYRWAINRLQLVMTSVLFLDLIYLVVMTMMLFMAAALLLPSRAEDEQESLRTFFEREGRYGLIPLSGLLILGFVGNAVYFHSSPLSI